MNHKKKILFRADANPQIGTGDLVSCIFLSAYLEELGWEAHFMVKASFAAEGLLKARTIKRVVTLTADCPIEKEVEKINRYGSEKNIDALFFNITQVPLSSYENIDKTPVIGCACFDGNIFHGVDWVLNWDVDAHTLFNRNSCPDTAFFLGPEFAILPKDFTRENIQKRGYKKKPETVLITMGGADEKNYTQKVADALIKQKSEWALRIVVGAGYKFLGELEGTLMHSSVPYEIIKNITNMREEYLNCDIAISAGGLSAFELAATMTPAILIAAVSHQQSRCKYLEKRGMAIYHGCQTVVPKLLTQQVRRYVIPKEGICFNGAQAICSYFISIGRRQTRVKR